MRLSWKGGAQGLSTSSSPCSTVLRSIGQQGTFNQRRVGAKEIEIEATIQQEQPLMRRDSKHKRTALSFQRPLFILFCPYRSIIIITAAPSTLRL